MDSSRATSVLLLDGGELPRLRRLLSTLQMRVVELPEEPDADVAADLLIATARGARALPPELVAREGALPDVWVGLIEEGAPLEHPTLTEACFDFVIRPPIEDVALRTLLRHLSYRGPERRREPRTAVGKPVRFLTDARPRAALLVDLSRGGCRLLVAPDALGHTHALQPGRRIRVSLGPEATGGESVVLGGRVVRRTPGVDRRHQEVSVAFEVPEPDAARTLKAALERSANASARLHRRASAQAVETAGVAAEDAGAERRRAERHRYEHPVVTLGRHVRVLAGVDLSPGGVRVLGGARPSVGDHLELAVYGERGEVPLVLSAVAAADYGDHGTLLRFEDVSDAEAEHLAWIASRLPALRPDADEGAEPCILLTQAVD